MILYSWHISFSLNFYILYGKWNNWRICNSAEKGYVKLVSQNLALESAMRTEKRLQLYI